jgi:hypothetical protein
VVSSAREVLRLTSRSLEIDLEKFWDWTQEIQSEFFWSRAATRIRMTSSNSEQLKMTLNTWKCLSDPLYFQGIRLAKRHWYEAKWSWVALKPWRRFSKILIPSDFRTYPLGKAEMLNFEYSPRAFLVEWQRSVVADFSTNFKGALPPKNLENSREKIILKWFFFKNL